MTNTVPERQNFRTITVLRVINFVENVFVSIVHSNFLKWILNGILSLFISFFFIKFLWRTFNASKYIFLYHPIE